MKTSVTVLRRGEQRGVVLVVALILLVMVTLFALSAIRLATTELQIAGNAQLRKELAAAAQEGIEMRINSMTDFNNLISGVAVPEATYAVQGGRYSVKVGAPVCIKSEPLPGNSLVSAGVTGSEMTYWEVVANVADSQSGAQMTTTQGLKIRLALGSCP